MRSINRKSNFQLVFYHIIPQLVSFIESHQSTVILLLKHKQYHTPCPQFSNDRMISQNIRKSNTSSSQIKKPQKLLKTHLCGNPYEAPIVLLHYVCRFCCCCPTYLFSLDFPVLWQELGKSQNIVGCILLYCITMSVYLSNLIPSKCLRNFGFLLWFLSFQNM